MRKRRDIHRKLALFILAATSTLLIAGCQNPMEATPLPIPASTGTPSREVRATDIPASHRVNGTFGNQISNLEENMPRSDSEGYVIPTKEEQAAFADLVSALGRDDFVGAIGLAADHGYRLNYYVDRGDNQAASYLLREERSIQKGWGVYAFRVDSTSNIIVEAPHPLADKRTPSLALAVYRALDAGALLIAGAHRYANGDGSADVAHAPESIFQTVHETLSREMQAESGSAVILQIHGFHTSKHNGYPQAVFGFGENIHATETAWAKKLHEAFSEHGLTVGLCVGEAWRDLCGRTNVQAYTSHGAVFIHIELDEELRKNPDAFLAALVQVFAE